MNAVLTLACLAGLAPSAPAAVLQTEDGLRLSAALPSALTELRIDDQAASRGTGGLSLLDPKTGKPVEAGRFGLSVLAKPEPHRLVLSGVVTAAGDQDTVCQLQARIPVGGDGWLFWDDASRSRAVRAGESYVQSVYPVLCVTDPASRLGLAVALDPEPLQPASLSYDPALKSVIVNWFFGFTPLARPELRMRAPFTLELYRVAPKWAFRSALEGYYRFHPKQFDWRARYEGLWLFASASDSLPNPQHYAYDEGGPPPTADLPRGIATFPYTCAGDLIVALPPEWGVAKNYDEMVERLQRWEKLPRLEDWDELSAYTVDQSAAHSGACSLKLTATGTGQDMEVRQTLDLNQKRVDPVTVAVWTRAQDVNGAQDNDYGVWLDMKMADGEDQFGKLAPANVGSHDWQQLKVTVGADKPIAQIRLYVLFRRTHTGAAWFDDVSVTTASDPKKNLARNPGFEGAGPPPQSVLIRDNVMQDENGQMRYFADTFGGADIPPPSPLNWLRFVLLVNPDQKNPESRSTASDLTLQQYDSWFRQSPQCAGAYLDGTSGWSTTTDDYRRDHFPCFRDPFRYVGTNFRVCASGKASVARWVAAFRERYADTGKLAFGNVWASNAMFPVCMALDVCGYESSRWYDLDYMDYYRAAAYHKPGLLLNYFRIGQQLDTREGGERFFRYATAYGLFPSIGRYTDEAYEKFGDLQHLYIPIVKRLFRAGWEPVTHAECSDPNVRVQRFGTKAPLYFTLLNPGPAPREVELTVDTAPLGLKASSLHAVEVVGSAALPLQASAASVSTRLALGPEDVAVVALFSGERTEAAWFRERAGASLQGAAYVYAQTPPTVKAVDLARRVSAVDPKRAPREVAQTLGAVKADLAALRAEAAKLPDDLKRRSTLRELQEAERLLDESLLADTGRRVSGGNLIAPLDRSVSLPEVPAGEARVVARRVFPGRVVELPLGAGSAAPEKIACPPERAVTLATELEFTDAAGATTRLTRRAYAFFGPICRLSAQADVSKLSVHLTNSDNAAREFTLQVSAPPGLTATPAHLTLKVPAGATKDISAALAYAPELKSGSYPVKVTAATSGGVTAEETTVPVVYVLPLAQGDLALAAAGGHVAVDSCYFAYSEKPLNDGVVLPVGMPFNEAAWASGEAAEDHWVEVQWPEPKTVGRVVIYWNVENDAVWTSHHLLVQVRDGDTWKTLAEIRPAGAEPVTECRFPATSARALRLLQPKGDGPAGRPNLMWLREVAAYPG